MILVGKKLIDFNASVVLPDNSIDLQFNLYKQTEGKKVVLFFYPLDFTFVCPSEIITLNKKMNDFRQRNSEVVAISVDSHFTHLAYKKTPISEGGIGNIEFPMVSDIKKNIAKEYGILYDESVALRAVFIADENRVVRHVLVNDLPLGRNIDEIVRILDSIDYHNKHGEVCPANWYPGQSAMVPTDDGVKEYLKNNFTAE